MKLKWLIALLLLNAAYVAALPSATIFYVANVLLHVVSVSPASSLLCWQWRRSPKIAVLIAAALLGGFLVVKGAITDNRWALVGPHRVGCRRISHTVAARTLARRTRRTRDFSRCAAFRFARGSRSQSRDRPAVHGRRRRRSQVALLAFGGEHQHGQDHPVRFLHGLRPLRRMSQGHLPAMAEFHAPLRVLQQSVLSPLHRAHAGVERNARQQVVRRMSRPRRILQRPLRPSHQRTGRHARGAERSGLPLLPLHHSRQRLGGERRLHHWISAAAQPGVQQESMDQEGQRVHHLPQSRTAPPHVHEALSCARIRPSSARLATKCIWTCPSTITAGSAVSTNTTTGRPAESRDKARGRFTIRPNPRPVGSATCSWCPRRIRATTEAWCTRTASPPRTQPSRP